MRYDMDYINGGGYRKGYYQDTLNVNASTFTYINDGNSIGFKPKYIYYRESHTATLYNFVHVCYNEDVSTTDVTYYYSKNTATLTASNLIDITSDGKVGFKLVSDWGTTVYDIFCIE